MRPAAVAQQQILIKIQLLDLNQQQWILSYFVDKAAHSLAVIHFPGGRGRCLLGKSNTREPGQWSDQRNSYISLVFAAAPNTVHAKLEALHARMHTTKQMHQKGLLQAAAANGVWPILKSSINEGGEAQLDRFPSIITTAKPLLVFGNAWLKQLVLRENFFYQIAHCFKKVTHSPNLTELRLTSLGSEALHINMIHKATQALCWAPSHLIKTHHV